MDIWQEAKRMEEYVRRIQLHLHENPELSDQEEDTVALILRELENEAISAVNVPGGGVLGFITGGKPGKTVLLRADIDALPMEEAPCNDLKPKQTVSKRPGAAHTCGHDAHTAMLLGAARILQNNREAMEGNVVLFFERGEEHGMGDLYMMEYIQQNKIHVNGAWAMHMRPGIPAGKIGLRPGGINAGSCGWSVRLEKMEGNPYSLTDCAVGIIHNLNTVRMRKVSPFESLTIAPCKLQVDENGCILAGCCRFNEREKVGRPINAVWRTVLEESCAAYGYTPVKVGVGGPTRNIVNNQTAYEIACKAITEALGAEQVVMGELGLGGESFPTLANYYPSIMAHLGNRNPEKGTTTDLHNPHFEVDPDVLKYGVAATVAYALGFLAHKEPIPFTPYTGDIREYYATNK